MGAKPEPCYNRIRAINDCVIMRLQCMSEKIAVRASEQIINQI